MNKTVRNLERCKDCGNGKFVDEKCKCLKPLLIKKPKYKIPCQFCGEKVGRELNWKVLKVSCITCKDIFRKANANRAYKGKKTLKWTLDNYKLIVVAGEKLS